MKTLMKLALSLLAFAPLSMNAADFGYGCGDCCGSDFYISGWGGYNGPFNYNHHDSGSSSEDASWHHKTNGGWFAGAAIGTHICDWRTDLSFDYIHNQHNRHRGSDVTVQDSDSSSRNHLNQYVLLVNGYYDFCGYDCWVPYVGVGLGFSHLNTSHDRHYNQNSFAWQVGAGIAYKIDECWSANFNYRLLGVVHKHGSGYHNLVGLGLTRNF